MSKELPEDVQKSLADQFAPIKSPEDKDGYIANSYYRSGINMGYSLRCAALEKEVGEYSRNLKNATDNSHKLVNEIVQQGKEIAKLNGLLLLAKDEAEYYKKKFQDLNSPL